MFLLGLNQVAQVYLTAMRKRGVNAATEGGIPVWALSGKLGFGGDLLLEASYEINCQASAINSYGIFVGAANFGYGSSREFCPVSRLAVGPAGGWARRVTDTSPDMMIVPGDKGRDGDGGLAFKLPVKNVGNCGFFAMYLTSCTLFSGRLKRGGRTSLVPPPLAMRDYAGDICLYGLTRLGNWPVGAELSHSPNQAAQINGDSILQAAFI